MTVITSAEESLRAEEIEVGAANGEMREAQIPAEMQHLGEMVEKLVQGSEELAQRLQPLTGALAADSENARNKTVSELVPLACEIANIRRKAERAADNIDLIYRNLEI